MYNIATYYTTVRGCYNVYICRAFLRSVKLYNIAIVLKCTTVTCNISRSAHKQIWEWEMIRLQI